MSVSLREVLRAVFTRADAEISIPVKGHIPQDSPLPYIRARINPAEDWSTKCQQGYAMDIVFDVWSDKHSDEEVLLYVDELMEAFDRKPLTLLDGSQCVILQQNNLIVHIELDGQTHRGTLYMSALITDAT